MKRLPQFLCLVPALALLSCQPNMEYDISGGYNKDITLFEDEITVPVGSIGPITVISTLMQSSLGQLFSEYIKEEPETGALVIESESTAYAVNVHHIEEHDDEFVWEPGSQSCSVGGIAAMLGFFKIQTLNQGITVLGSNPLRSNVPFSFSGTIDCYDKSYRPTYSQAFSPDLTILDRNKQNLELAKVELPASVTDLVSTITLEDLSMTLPNNHLSKIYDENKSDVFTFKVIHKCLLGVAEDFTFNNEADLTDLHAEIGKFKLSRCEASIEIENTLPLSVTINSISVLKPSEADAETLEVDDNIAVTAGVTIPGGSLEKPGKASVNLAVSATDGAIPDINALRLDIDVNGTPGCGGVALSARQGLYVKSSSVKISGGITIPLNQ